MELRNNSTVFEELEVSIVDLMVANAALLANSTVEFHMFKMADP
jgi:hypothetical protein